MLERVIAELLVWGIRGGVAWLVVYEYTTYVEDKLTQVMRSLGSLSALGGM